MRARRSSYLEILTSRETLFAFFCSALFLTYHLIDLSPKRGFLRSRSSRKKSSSFFVCLCFRRVTAAVLSSCFPFAESSLSRRSLNFSSLLSDFFKGRLLSPQHNHLLPLKKRCLFSSVTTTKHIYYTHAQKEREKEEEKEGKVLSRWEQLQTQRRRRRQTRTCERTKTRCDRSCISCSLKSNRSWRSTNRTSRRKIYRNCPEREIYLKLILPCSGVDFARRGS